MLETVFHQLKKTATDLLSFLKKPTDQPVRELNTAGKARILLLVLLIDVVLTFVLMGLIQLVNFLGWYENDNHAVMEMLKSFPLWSFLLLGVLVIPLAEELVFRFGLRFRRGYIAFMAVVVLVTLGVLAFYLLPLVGAIAVVVLLFMALVLYALNADAIGDYLERVWPKMYGVVFYVIALLFGLVHITNFTDFNYASAAILLIPILIAPQIWAGLLLGYMRVKHGFFWGFFLHAGHNAFFFGLALLTMGSLDEKLNISNENYSLKVEERILHDPTATTRYKVGKDSIVFVNKDLKDVIEVLLKKERNYLQYGKQVRLNKTINLSYKNHTVDYEQDKERVLAELQKLYKFKITTDNWEQEIWDLAVADSSTLSHYAVKDEGRSRTEVSSTEITMESVTMEELLKTVNNEFYVVLNNKTATPGRYNFKFAKNGFDQFKEDLKSRYGLILEPRTIIAEHAIIELSK